MSNIELHNVMHFSPETWVYAGSLAVFLFLVIYKGRDAILKTLDDKADEIRRELDEARKLHEDARKMKADYERKFQNAMREAEDIVAKAKEAADILRDQASKEVETLIARRAEAAQSRIAQAETTAVNDVRAAAAELAIAATRHLLIDNMDDAHQARLVEGTVAGLTDALSRSH